MFYSATRAINYFTEDKNFKIPCDGYLPQDLYDIANELNDFIKDDKDFDGYKVAYDPCDNVLFLRRATAK